MRPVLRLLTAATLLYACCLANAATAVPPLAPALLDSWMAPADSDGPALENKTIRETIRLSVGGHHPRLRLSNAFGTGPLTIGPVRLRSKGRAHAVTFGGAAKAVIAAGAEVLSDPVATEVAALEQLDVALYVGRAAGPSTVHSDARQSAYLSDGNSVGAAQRPAASSTDTSHHFLTGIAVDRERTAGALVVVGDSITDGDQSGIDASARWTDALAARLQHIDPAQGLAPVAVLNAGISGNRLLKDGPVGLSALKRFDQDALARAGVRWVLLEIGINDIGLADQPATPDDAVSAQDVIDGLAALAARARARGVQIWGATLTPYGGATSPLLHSAAAEQKRQRINQWIRGAGSFAHVADFDAALRDPADPQRLLPAYDSGDHVHPNDAGYARLAASIAPAWFSAP